MALSTEQELVLGLYKAYLDDLGRIGSRHETARAFYLSVISALFVFLSLGGTTGALLPIRADVQVLVGLVGVVVSFLWFMHMASFGALYLAKFSTLRKAEESLPVKPFTEEASFLADTKRIRMTFIDKGVAVAFIILFFILIALKSASAT